MVKLKRHCDEWVSSAVAPGFELWYSENIQVNFQRIEYDRGLWLREMT